MTVHQKVDELIAAYSLGAVSAEEATMVRRHLPDCPECQATLLRMTEVVAVLPLSLEEVAPPEGLRERLLARAGDRQAPGLTQTSSLGSDVRAVQTTGRSLALRQTPRWAPVAAAAVLLVALLGWNVSLQNRPAPASTNLQSTLLDTSRSGVGTITYLKDRHLALVSLHALSSPSPNKTYELWIIPKGGKAEPAGVFVPEPDGTKVLVVSHSINPGDTVAVTQEDAGGVLQPTGLVEISGRI